MRTPKLEATLEGKLFAETVEPTPVYEDGRRLPDEQAVNADGVPLWTVSCLYREDGARPEIVNIKIASDSEPKFTEGGEVKLPLIAIPYINGNYIRYSFSVDTERMKRQQAQQAQRKAQ